MRRMKKAEDLLPVELLSPLGRISFPKLSKPVAMEGSDKARFSIGMIWNVKDPTKPAFVNLNKPVAGYEKGSQKMKLLTTRKNHETTIHGERFSSRAAAEKFATALASSGRIDELVSIEDEAGPDFLETLRGMHTDELSLPYDDRKERTICELRACLSLVRAMRGVQTRVNMHSVLLDVVNTCPIGSPEAKELYEAAEDLLPGE